MTIEEPTALDLLNKKLDDAQQHAEYWKGRYNDASERSNANYDKYDKAMMEKKNAQATMGVLILVCIGLLISLAAIMSSTVLGQMLIGVLVAFVAAGAAFLLFHMIRDNL